MTETERFLFDLNGYLTLDGVLDADEVAAANEAIDRHACLLADRHPGLAHTSAVLKGSTGKTGFTKNPLGFDRPWCEPFRRMLTQPRVVAVFNEVLGPGFRLDHGPMLIQMVRETEGHWLHGGLTFDPSRYHRFEHGKIRCGLCVAAFQLTEVRPGDGGFVCIPGSHKANFRPPQTMLSMEDDLGFVRQVAAAPGSVIIFNEALIHGTFPWQPADRVRRSVLFKYSPGFLAWDKTPPCPIVDPTSDELGLYQPPFRTGRPLLGGVDEECDVIYAHGRPNRPPSMGSSGGVGPRPPQEGDCHGS
jgi:ectoine hydroxylase-related dioxygenase (phytanoyl-CoA dioxygenase family)